jgi:flagellar biogenesis protein FliO
MIDAMRVRWLIFILALVAITQAGVAQTTQPAAGEIRRNSAAAAGSNAAGPSATRTALSLAAVLALIVILFLAGRKFLPRRMFAQQGGGGGGGAIQVLARTAISPKQRIILLQVGRRILVVADGGPNLTTLAEITDPGEAAALIGQLQSEKPSGSFTSALNGAMDRFRTAQERPEPRSDLNSMREEIEGLAKRVRGMAR